MGDPQLVSHDLERMLAMRLPKVLMQHDAMADSKDRIYAVHCQQNDIGKIAG